MKKTGYLLISLCLVLIVGMGGCSHSSADNDEENTAIAQQGDHDNDTDKGAIETQQEEQQATSKVKKVNVGKTFTIPDMFEVTLNSAEWQDEVVFEGDGISTTMEKQREGASYFVVSATVKNIGTGNETVGHMNAGVNLSGSFKINDSYDIEASMVVDDEGTARWDIGPLMTNNVIIYGTVSDEIRDSFKNCTFILDANLPGEDGMFHSDANPVGTYIAEYE